MKVDKPVKKNENLNSRTFPTGYSYGERKKKVQPPSNKQRREYWKVKNEKSHVEIAQSNKLQPSTPQPLIDVPASVHIYLGT